MDTPTLEESLAFRIYRTQRLLRQNFLASGEAAGFDLTPEQFFLLNKLRRDDGQPQGALVDPALGDRPNLTRIVAGLERRGLVQRSADPTDRRVRRVHLTEEGAALHDAFVAAVVWPVRDALFGDLTPQTTDAVHTFLTLLEHRLQS